MTGIRYRTYRSWLTESDDAKVYRDSFATFDTFPAALDPAVKRQLHDVLFRASKYAWIEYRDSFSDQPEKKKKRADK